VSIFLLLFVGASLVQAHWKDIATDHKHLHGCHLKIFPPSGFQDSLRPSPRFQPRLYQYFSKTLPISFIGVNLYYAGYTCAGLIPLGVPLVINHHTTAPVPRVSLCLSGSSGAALIATRYVPPAHNGTSMKPQLFTWRKTLFGVLSLLLLGCLRVQIRIIESISPPLVNMFG